MQSPPGRSAESFFRAGLKITRSIGWSRCSRSSASSGRRRRWGPIPDAHSGPPEGMVGGDSAGVRDGEKARSACVRQSGGGEDDPWHEWARRNRIDPRTSAPSRCEGALTRSPRPRTVPEGGVTLVFSDLRRAGGAPECPGTWRAVSRRTKQQAGTSSRAGRRCTSPRQRCQGPRSGEVLFVAFCIGGRRTDGGVFRVPSSRL